MDSIDDVREDFIDILTKISFPRIIKELTILFMSQRFWRQLDLLLEKLLSFIQHSDWLFALISTPRLYVSNPVASFTKNSIMYIGTLVLK